MKITIDKMHRGYLISEKSIVDKKTIFMNDNRAVLVTPTKEFYQYPKGCVVELLKTDYPKSYANSVIEESVEIIPSEEFINDFLKKTWVRIGQYNQAEVRLDWVFTDGTSQYVYDKEFKRVYLARLDKHIELNNKKWLCNDFGKYRPNLSFIMDSPFIPEDAMKPIELSEFNLSGGNIKYLKGAFRISKKGNPVFDMTSKEKSHYLLLDSWGGSFNDYRGGNIDKLNTVYFRRASSNGGGSGNDWAVVNVGERFEMSENDI